MANIGLLKLGQRTTSYYQQHLEQNLIKYSASPSLAPLPLRRKPNTKGLLILIDTDFNAINALLPDQHQSIIELLTESVLPLVENSNIEQLIIPNITLHECIEQLPSWFQELCIHPLIETIKLLQQKQCNEIVLVASMHSMNSDYISSYFKQQGIDVSLPTMEHQYHIDRYRRKVYQTIESDTDTESYLQLITHYSRNIPVVIACTELSLNLPNINRNAVISMVDIQINQASMAF